MCVGERERERERERKVVGLKARCEGTRVKQVLN